MLNRPLRAGLLIALGASLSMANDQGEPTHVPTPSGWRQHDVHRPKPPVVEPGEGPVGAAAAAPKDAVVLFDGGNLDAWTAADGGPAAWKVADGALEVVPGKGAIRTKASFGDAQLHVEWSAPDPPTGKGQDRGNSGIFLMGCFELQVLDSHQSDSYADGMAGAIYGQFPPLYNAARPPGQWQAYDIAFRAPRFDSSGGLSEPARMTIFLNGVLVQNNEALVGRTSWLESLPYEPGVVRGPIELQDHGHRVRFRNIWIRELPERPAPTEEQKRIPKPIALTAAELDAFAGVYSIGAGASAVEVTVARRGDHLTFKVPFRPVEIRVVPVSPLHFEMPGTDGRVVFEKDDQGRVTGAKLVIGDGGERPMRRVGP